MALRFALLAALHEQPSTGYELTQRFRSRLGHVWTASHQQIYRELGKLHDEGLLAMETIAQEERPDRKRYQVTERGIEALRDWLAEPQPRPAVRDPLLLKLFAGELLDDSAMAEELAALKQACREQLATYRAIQSAWFSEPAALPRHYRLQYLALRRGITGTEAMIAWLDEVEREFGADVDGNRSEKC